ncbi:aminotransferase class V-fold PLP-dependent enzyme [Clostridium tyrobutyricum]|jgi:methionine-gamma-lyase|uniref:homocysteine desulfhydrase n=1 Tax=Clostridium tyrobutyricum DIVETGP TaxID=1408889 RepID=W6N8L6_CLOTY|nr:aminotransferase class I/II-fold pyridoxal phosphate-dependent enzyme [Clostridium tyrobutyricum]AND84671.1 cystathionine gamma-synthase [Clostridium tyrobutyricum]ANP69270.1 cystathionine gamma-lyase [Clostridium tyrobutyricum]MBV4426332.1 aminotransferase class I/II-fold pyridoxal phosphate-dependent enzyme [Clostridium tyrobutyricum]MBV4427438.1 aminotransferase class I/II-fold pyridoxal phosphate-dependent enzyme [Clostridium tyrobutyricum]MBV4432393.1 aminotransferase class I/II-fold p
MSKEPSFITKCVHVGNGIDKETGSIRRPITMANCYRLPEDASSINWSDPNQILYTRNTSANQLYLQQRLAALEGGEDCVVLASGVAALAGVFFTFLGSNSHVICSNVSYIAVYRLLNQYLPDKYGVEATLVDTSDVEKIKKAIRPNTKLIHVETPGNPTTKISDIEEISQIAKSIGALFSVDSTFASPYLQHPLELGADLVVHSLTKYINGHGDAMGGAVIGKKEIIDRIKSEAMVNLGGTISPFNAWLIMRGVVTLPLRMKQHSDTALEVAKYLEANPAVKFVAYPGLESHPQHDIAKKQMKMYSGVIAFALKADSEIHNKFINSLELVVPAVSLGHDESLIVYTGPDDERIDFYPEEFRDGYIRFSIGLESAEDIIDDLKQALKKCGF